MKSFALKILNLSLSLSESIDPKITSLINLLNAKGFATYSSCQGLSKGEWNTSLDHDDIEHKHNLWASIGFSKRLPDDIVSKLRNNGITVQNIPSDRTLISARDIIPAGEATDISRLDLIVRQAEENQKFLDSVKKVFDSI